MGILDAPVQIKNWAYGTRVSLSGNSLMAQNNADATAGGGVYNTLQAVGWITQANQILGHAMNIVFNCGVSGATFAPTSYGGTAQFSTYLPQLLASNSDIVIVQDAVNDLSEGLTAAQIMPYVTAHVQPILNSGKKVILVMTVGGAGINTAPQIAQLGQLAQLYREFARTTKNVYLYDPTPYVRNPTAIVPTLALPISGDGTHFIPYGAYIAGHAFAKFIAPLLNPFPSALHGLLEERTYNPMNPMTNGMFTTTTGGVNGGERTSGPVPSGWSASVLGTQATVVVSNFPDPGGFGNIVQLAITSTQALDMGSLFATVPPSNLSAGAIVDAEVEYKVVSSTNLIGVELLMDLNITNGGVTSDLTSYDNFCENAAMVKGPPTTGWMKLKVRPRQIPSSSTSINSVTPYIKCVFGGAGSAVVWIRRAKMQIQDSTWPPSYNGIIYG
jgi:hypothetical protein